MTRCVLIMAVLGLSLPLARADKLESIGLGLAYAGFDVIGTPNPLSGGADLLITRQFDQSVFDFGVTELTLQGPLSLDVSTGTRLFPSLDISFSTAVDARSNPSPLGYSLVTDIGPQLTSVSGTVLIDADLSINALGFYDMSLTYSNRRTIQQEGIVDSSQTLDADLGPINVAGNVYLDALAIVTDPLFEAAGKQNPIAALSKALINLDIPAFSDGPLFSNSEEGLLSAGKSQSPLLHPGLGRDRHGKGPPPGFVPEPAALFLLLLGVPVLIHRTRRCW